MIQESFMPMTRARLLGALALVGAFLAGGVTVWAVTRQSRGGFRVSIVATDQMPEELERLGLDATQRDRLRPVLRRGRDRVLKVVDSFDPMMRAAVDSTDAEIKAVLTEAQRAALAKAREKSGPLLERRQVTKP